MKLSERKGHFNNFRWAISTVMKVEDVKNRLKRKLHTVNSFITEVPIMFEPVH